MFSGIVQGVGKINKFEEVLKELMLISKKTEEVLKEFSRQYLQTLLQETGRNITRAADRAGMERPNFRRLLKRYGVTRPTGSQTVDG